MILMSMGMHRGIAGGTLRRFANNALFDLNTMYIIKDMLYESPIRTVSTVIYYNRVIVDGDSHDYHVSYFDESSRLSTVLFILAGIDEKNATANYDGTNVSIRSVMGIIRSVSCVEIYDDQYSSDNDTDHSVANQCADYEDKDRSDADHGDADYEDADHGDANVRTANNINEIYSAVCSRLVGKLMVCLDGKRRFMVHYEQLPCLRITGLHGYRSSIRYVTCIGNTVTICRAAINWGRNQNEMFIMSFSFLERSILSVNNTSYHDIMKASDGDLASGRNITPAIFYDAVFVNMFKKRISELEIEGCKYLRYTPMQFSDLISRRIGLPTPYKKKFDVDYVKLWTVNTFQIGTFRRIAIEILLELGINVDDIDRDGVSISSVVEKSSNRDIINILSRLLRSTVILYSDDVKRTIRDVFGADLQDIPSTVEITEPFIKFKSVFAQPYYIASCVTRPSVVSTDTSTSTTSTSTSRMPVQVDIRREFTEAKERGYQQSISTPMSYTLYNATLNAAILSNLEEADMYAMRSDSICNVCCKGHTGDRCEAYISCVLCGDVHLPLYPSYVKCMACCGVFYKGPCYDCHLARCCKAVVWCEECCSILRETDLHIPHGHIRQC